MRKLILGLTLLGSMSSFGNDYWDKVLTDISNGNGPEVTKELLELSKPSSNFLRKLDSCHDKSLSNDLCKEAIRVGMEERLTDEQMKGLIDVHFLLSKNVTDEDIENTISRLNRL